MMTTRYLAGLALLAALLAGCSNRQIYDSSVYLRMQDCDKLAEHERAVCLEQARMPYDEYQKSRKEAEGKAP